ncbi:hypothetical protein LCGC14_1074480, partial [marine sediment metagenome]
FSTAKKQYTNKLMKLFFNKFNLILVQNENV